MSRTYSTAEFFLQPKLQLVKITGHLWWKDRIYRLVEEYAFEWGPENARKMWIMAPGFEYNKASTPAFGRVLGFIPDGDHEAASMFHDRLYRDKGIPTPGEFQFFTQINGEWLTDSSRWKRSEADDLFEYMATLGGMSKHKAAIEKWAVKLYPVNWFKGF